ncbi:MAG: rod shape-determining protein [Candidatus Omnitrophica bacterium]|nr:rod shape-determining protein [Candidatus Omnitrophota bacterium]
MKKNFICGLDIGTYKICAACGTISPSGTIDILASYRVPTQGLKAGQVLDSKRLSACIKEAADQARKISGLRFKRVYANIDSPDLRAKLYRRNESFGERAQIKRRQLEKLINSTISSNVPLGRKVVHAEDFINQGLKLNIVIVSALIPTINSFIKSIRDAGLILDGLIPSGCAQVLALFKDKPEVEQDNILIDVGAGLSKITCFRNRLAKDMVILPLGGQSITEDIAARLRVSFDCAEKLKIKYGRCFYEDRFLDQKIIVKDKAASKIIQPAQLCEIIAVKVDHLLQEIKKALSKLDYQDEKVGEIVVTGGGSILEGFLERAEKILGKTVKMGFLSAVNDSHIQAQSALYATSIGLIHFGLKNRGRKRFYTRERINAFMNGLKRARELYQEYF